MNRKKIAKKKFGQNFLTDETILKKIIEAKPNTQNRVVEIGPGLGDLTRFLVLQNDVEAFEVDMNLCRHLDKLFADELASNRLTLHCGDVLESWGAESLIDAPYDLVANLPYYIATNIVLRALRDENCQNLLVMVQKEVAQKFCATEEERAFSALSVIVQTVGEAKVVVVVPPQAFEPPPKIDSAVILIRKSRGYPSEDFLAFLHVAFSQPRKTLAKNLSSSYSKLLIRSTIEMLSLSLNVRPHQVPTSVYHQLYEKLQRSLDGRDNQRGAGAK